jgi:hypothetical protein
VLPHQPYCEQQFPKIDPWHVVVVSQDPSILIAMEVLYVVVAGEEALAIVLLSLLPELTTDAVGVVAWKPL